MWPASRFVLYQSQKLRAIAPCGCAAAGVHGRRVERRERLHFLASPKMVRRIDGSRSKNNARITPAARKANPGCPLKSQGDADDVFPKPLATWRLCVIVLEAVDGCWLTL